MSQVLCGHVPVDRNRISTAANSCGPAPARLLSTGPAGMRPCLACGRPQSEALGNQLPHTCATEPPDLHELFHLATTAAVAAVDWLTRAPARPRAAGAQTQRRSPVRCRALAASPIGINVSPVNGRRAPVPVAARPSAPRWRPTRLGELGESRLVGHTARSARPSARRSSPRLVRCRRGAERRGCDRCRCSTTIHRAYGAAYGARPRAPAPRRANGPRPDQSEQSRNGVTKKGMS